LAGIAKVIAGLRGIFHSDELPAYGITEAEVEKVKKVLKPSKNDAFILVAADEVSAHKALKSIAMRCSEALDGVPKEVRKADGQITGFMRPLPGSARMYPETDEPVVKITKDMLDIELPKTFDEVKKELEKTVGPELANQLVHSRVLEKFKNLSKELKVKPSVIASTLLAAPEGIDVVPVLKLVDAGKVAKESIEDMIKDMVAGKSAEEAAKDYMMMSEAEVKKKIAQIIKENEGANFGQIMGAAMTQLRGKASAQTVQKLIRELS